jgi:hypothetical protein
VVAIKLRQSIGSMEIIVWLPAIVLSAVSTPFDQVLDSPVSNATVEYSFDFKLFFAIYQGRREWSDRISPWDRVRNSEGEFDDGEHWM